MFVPDLLQIFSRGTIQWFHENASAMKKLAARDFEDLLQVELLLSNSFYTNWHIQD